MGLLSRMKKRACKHKELLIQAKNLSTLEMTTNASAIRVVCKDCGKVIIHPWQKIEKDM